MDPDGAIAKVVEGLTKRSPVMQDAVAVEGNLADGTTFTTREGLPGIGRRRFGQGVAPTKSTTSKVKEPVTLFEGNSAVDVALANLNGNAPAFRADEDRAFMQAFNNQVESALIYDSQAANEDQMNGLIHRLDSTSGPAGGQIVKLGAGGSNTNTSMLLVGWGKDTVHTIFPKGTKGGLDHKDMGEQLWDPNNDGKKFRAYVTNWNWQIGVAVKDKRFIAAVRNIDMSSESGGTIAAPVNDLIMAAIDAYHLIYSPEDVRLCWYVSRKLAAILHKQAVNSISKSTLSYEMVAGKPVVSLIGVPIRISDAIINTEAAIS